MIIVLVFKAVKTVPAAPASAPNPATSQTHQTENGSIKTESANANGEFQFFFFAERFSEILLGNVFTTGNVERASSDVISNAGDTAAANPTSNLLDMRLNQISVKKEVRYTSVFHM